MNLNKVMLIGRMAADPETRSTNSGQSVTSIRLATNRVWNDRQTGQKQEQVEFHSIVAWGGLSDVLNKYVKKGQLLLVEGRLQTRSWDGKDGVKRYRTEIVAENIQLGPKSSGTGSSDYESRQQTQSSPRQNNKSEEMSDDDIPVIDENSPTKVVSKGDPSEDVEEAEIDLKDIPF